MKTIKLIIMETDTTLYEYIGSTKQQALKNAKERHSHIHFLPKKYEEVEL